MKTREEILDVVVKVVAEVLEKTAEEVAQNPDAAYREDLGMTSVQLFPVISTLEEEFDVELDYSGFLTNAATINKTADYLVSVL